MSVLDGKKIADAVHGTIQLSPLESEVISTPVYQRLRGIKHLGMASLVFPGADYSRFSHGVGTSYVTGRIVSALQEEHRDVIRDGDMALYRMAALLHDIGHYPFSHTFERALKNHYSKTDLIKPKDAKDSETGGAPAGHMLHEEVGSLIIRLDERLGAVLDSGSIDREMLERIINRIEPPTLANLVSSDLDADRIDYMMRTAKHTGLPYGSLDLDYLLTQVCLDDKNRICLRTKGMRAAEHMLIARFFDYQQVSYHKTVQALELVLNEAVEALLRHSVLDCSIDAINGMISSGDWNAFDDATIITYIREAQRDKDKFLSEEHALFSSVLDRNPPKLVFEWEQFGSRDGQHEFTSIVKSVANNIDGWSSDFGVKFWPWNKGTELTKIGQRVPVSQAMDDAEDESYDKLQQAVRIVPNPGGKSVTLQENRRSLLSVLSEHALYAVRVYALLDPDDARRPAIEARIRADLNAVL